MPIDFIYLIAFSVDGAIFNPRTDKSIVSIDVCVYAVLRVCDDYVFAFINYCYYK